MPPSDFDVLRRVITSRRTEKVMSLGLPVEYSEATLREADAQLAECIRAAGWAPFHHDRGAGGVPEPWRVHWLRNPSCRQLAAEVPALITDLKPGTRLGSLLAGCGSLLLVTWLPEPGSADGDFVKRQTRNEEHLAAAAAFVQNVLLLATAAGFGTFWSSGALLRQPAVFRHLGLDAAEQLLAALFIDYAPGDTERAVETATGKQRGARSDWTRWCRVVEG